MRAFVALPVPEPVRFELMLCQQAMHRVSGLRLVAPDQFHVTLAFLGDRCDPELVEEAHHLLSAIRFAPVALRPAGLGLFGGGKPRNIHVALAPDPALVDLQRKVVQAARRAGLDPEARKFVPHITLARMTAGQVDGAALAALVAARAGLTWPMAASGEFGLYESHLSPSGPRYDELALYPASDGGNAALHHG